MKKKIIAILFLIAVINSGLFAQETQRIVGKEAMTGGIVKEGGGGGGTGALGDLAGLGVGLAAMGGVMGIAKETITPILNTSTGIGQSVTGMINPTTAVGANSVSPVNSIGWDCTCGEKAIKGNFCTICGNKKPKPIIGWACIKCSTTNDKGIFCSNCGEKKPENTSWDCTCGEKQIKGKFCSNCGKNKGE